MDLILVCAVCAHEMYQPGVRGVAPGWYTAGRRNPQRCVQVEEWMRKARNGLIAEPENDGDLVNGYRAGATGVPLAGTSSEDWKKGWRLGVRKLTQVRRRELLGKAKLVAAGIAARFPPEDLVSAPRSAMPRQGSMGQQDE